MAKLQTWIWWRNMSADIEAKTEPVKEQQKLQKKRRTSRIGVAVSPKGKG